MAAQNWRIIYGLASGKSKVQVPEKGSIFYILIFNLDIPNFPINFQQTSLRSFVIVFYSQFGIGPVTIILRVIYSSIFDSPIQYFIKLDCFYTTCWELSAIIFVNLQLQFHYIQSKALISKHSSLMCIYEEICIYAKLEKRQIGFFIIRLIIKQTFPLIHNLMYEVDSIVNKRMNPETNSPEYFVKWVGFPDQENTWEPEKNLKFVKNLIDQFNERTQLKGQIIGQNQTKQETKPIKKTRPPNSDDQQNLQIFQEEQSQNQDDSSKEQDIQSKEQQIKQAKQTVQKSQTTDDIRKQAKFDKQDSKNIVTNTKTAQQQIKNKLLQKKIAQQKQIECERKNLLSKSKENSLQKMQLGKRLPPPMPPDFSINRSKYIDPYSAPHKLSLVPQKHKMIEKQKLHPNKNKNKIQLMQPKRPQSGNNYHNLMNGSSFKNEQMLKQFQMKSNNNFRPPSKLIPPPPLPRLSQVHNYQPNHPQSNGYRTTYEQQSPNQYHNPPPFPNRHTKDVSISKRHPSPRYKYENIGQNHQSHLSQSYEYNLQGVSQGYGDNGYSYQKNLVVYQILNMEKNQNGYIYFASTNEGSCWLNRDDIVPKFSTQLVQFYERYLTFQQ